MVDTLWQVVAAYAFALIGGGISTSLQLEHKQLCRLISFAAGTLLGVTFFAILPEGLDAAPLWAVLLAVATGYALFFFVSKHVHHVCPACAASYFDGDSQYDGWSGAGNSTGSPDDGSDEVVTVLCSLHPQGSRRACARESV